MKTWASSPALPQEPCLVICVGMTTCCLAIRHLVNRTNGCLSIQTAYQQQSEHSSYQQVSYVKQLLRSTIKPRPESYCRPFSDSFRSLLCKCQVKAHSCCEQAAGLPVAERQLRACAGSRRPEFMLDTALGMYDLKHVEVFWERLHDTHALLAWGPSRCVIVFRGTASFANVLADLQVCLLPRCCHSLFFRVPFSHSDSRREGERPQAQKEQVRAVEGSLHAWVMPPLPRCWQICSKAPFPCCTLA